MERKGHGRKSQPSASRPQRPAASQRRQQSYNGSYYSSGRPVLGASKRTETEIVSQDEDETGMASFIQFCATCERQIVTPSGNILYCSESCRRKDVSSTTAIDAVQSPSPIPSTSSYFDIVPPRSPTIPRPLSLTFSDLRLPEPGSRDFPQDWTSHGSTVQLRPTPNRASTATDSGIPSLINTPSSSVGTAASHSSYRPLPPRHDPLTGNGHFPRRSTDLVIPTYPTSSPVSSGSATSSVTTITATRSPTLPEGSFERQSISRARAGSASGSLNRLLSDETMGADPGGSRANALIRRSD